MRANINGVGVALITPFDDRGAVDFAALDRLVEHVTEGGVDYLVALGTTAETPTLSKSERNEIIACIKQSNRRGLPLVVGVGCNSTQHVVDDLASLDLAGVEAILSVAPYYNRPSQRGLVEHYRVVAEASPAPVIIYNVPTRTGVNITVDSTLRLAHDVPNICGVKEACGTLGQMAHILKGRPEGFAVLSGDDALAMPLAALGGDGVISVISNAFPAQFTAMVRAGFDGDVATASALYMRLLEATDAMFEEGNPTGVKMALYIKGLIRNNLRLPLVSGSEALEARIRKIVREEGL
ncbi:MAG: 4-hydroxy-tetrahydrodipicolinate synthase [Rikenellaceae bacterium]|jgi:4-hydroxy-tetrahydrodipicolinate synthase|nr:4-hydroxy-tetrahydrodipicolinate synthase [Rikenellaceae bacterium]